MLLQVVLLLLSPGLGEARRRKELPIDREPGEAGTQQRAKASECRFGGETYELEQTWHPDLGPPFNVMYCVHCECVPIHKKRRIVGRVRCKNIKTECPKPTCPEPLLLPGRCCKVCPGQHDNPDLTITVDLEREEQERNGRHYAAVLTGPGVEKAATARFYFRKKTLQYSFLFGEQLGWPSLLTFLDDTDDIIEEFGLVQTPLQARTGKLCGSWSRLPRKYRKTLRAEHMNVSLVTQLGTITGQVKKYYGLTTEMFSGLLEGSSGAGTAILSVSPATGSVHANILFEGLGSPGENPVSLVVRFTSSEVEGRGVEEEVTLPSLPQGLASLEIRTVFDQPELEALGRGELELELSLSRAPAHRLTAILVPRLSCDIFDCVLQPENSLQDSGQGMAFLYFTRTGGLAYNIRVEAEDEVTAITIDNGKRSKRLLTVIPGLERNFAEGWSNGTVLLTAGQVEELYKERLYLSVRITGSGSPVALRGRLVTHLAGPPEAGGAAVLLQGTEGVGGLAWASIDDTCRLNYNVRMEGADMSTATSSLELEDYPVQNLKALPLFPSQRMGLQQCSGQACSGHADNIHKLTIARLDSGDAAILVTATGARTFTLKGEMAGVSAPSSCLPSYARNDLESIPGYLSDLAEQTGDAELAAELRQKCVYEGGVREPGSRWSATHTPCTMCSCQRGKVVCEAMVCPPTNCTDPVIMEGECCSSCSRHTDSGRSCKFGGDSVFQPAGSRWHPYIPPFGFSRCAVCTCKEETLTVECTKKQCPPLTDCLHSEAVRVHPLDCCKVCPAQTTPAPTIAPEAGVRGDEAVAGPRELLDRGGCLWKGSTHRNGDSWHPTVVPWGEMVCVDCTCKDGNTACKKKRCPTLKCHLKLRAADTCCPRCAKGNKEEQAAVREEQATRREQRLRRLRRIHRGRRRQKGSSAG